MKLNGITARFSSSINELLGNLKITIIIKIKRGGKPKEGKLIDIATEPTSTDVPPLISHTPPPLRFLGDDFIIDPTIADDWDIIQHTEIPEDTPEDPKDPPEDSKDPPENILNISSILPLC